MTYQLFILEDEEIPQYIMKTLLRRFDTFAASYFDNAIALIDRLIRNAGQPEQLPDVIFIDLNMPGLNGWDVLDAIRHITPLLPKDIQVFITSTSVSPIDRQRALAYPFVRNFFSKPVSTAHLREVENYLAHLPFFLN